METNIEALSIFLRPQDNDYIGGGWKSLEYAVYDYCGIDLKGERSSEYVLESANPGVDNFYNKLCTNARIYASADLHFDMNTGYHTFDDDSQILRILKTFREDQSSFKLDYFHDDSNMCTTLTNLKNNKVFKFSVSSNNAEHHHAFLVLFRHWKEKKKEQQIEKDQLTVDDFLYTPQIDTKVEE
jgi:hypothetical protein